MNAENIARVFHEAYETLAPEFGYKTREESAVPWGEVPEDNKRLMIATVQHVMAWLLRNDGEFDAAEDLENYYRLEARIAELKARDRWIPVSEKLPEPGQTVLVWPDAPMPTRYIKPSGEWFFDAIPVEYWKPLPEPPSQEIEE